MYDLHNHILLKNRAENLKRFGISGAGVIFSDKFDQKLFSELKKSTNLKLFPGVEIHASRAGEVKKKVDKFRKLADIILVHAKDQRAARAAAENEDVDAIAHAFIDQTTAREAGSNKVAIEINLKDILGVYGIKRSVLLSKIKFNLSLARKYKVPLLLTTGASDIYDMRSPKQIMAVAECIGFTKAEAKRAALETPRNIVEKR